MTRLVPFALAILLAACGGRPDQVTFQVHADTNINPSPKGEAEPTAVRLYLLSSPTHLRGADYFELIDHEHATLDTDLLVRRDIIIMPGKKESLRLDVPKEATDVGVVVGYRDLDKATWLATRKLPSDGRVPVLLSGRTVTLPDKFPGTDP